MSRRDRKHAMSPPDAPPKARRLPDGRFVVRKPGTEPAVREIPGHGELLEWRAIYTDPNGRTWESWEFDFSRLKLPPGAIPADPSLQNFGLGGPKLWYVDVDRICVQCGLGFVFSADEQRFWYETLNFNDASNAIRCLSCRKKVRSVKALHNQLGLALNATDANPSDADAWLELARVTGEMLDRNVEGNMPRFIDRGLSAARKAWKLSEERLPEALYWESTFQHLAGRPEKAKPLEDAFLGAIGPEKRYREMIKKIEKRQASREHSQIS